MPLITRKGASKIAFDGSTMFGIIGLVLFLTSITAAQCGSGCCATNVCDGEIAPPGSNVGAGARWFCDTSTCECEFGSPIIIDTTGEGFHLTSAQDGVVFDIAGDGKPIQIAWTAANSRNAFLALDRNHNGTIDNGEELFGNFTKQPQSSDKNGFLALAEFDKPENGGDGDGIIDKKDAVFSRLLLWIDENHDGVSQPNELHHLPELGVYSISLRFRGDKHFVDEYGNWFHYQAALNPDPQDGESKDGRLTYDVSFITVPAHGQSVRPSVIPKSLSERSLTANLQADALPNRLTSTVTAPPGHYRYLLVGKNGTPKVQVWNDSELPITGLAITIDLSDGAHQVESRTYYDTFVNLGSDLPIYPHESQLISIGYRQGADFSKLVPKVRGVVFGDGTVVGERVWTKALMARRKHLYSSLLNLHGLLSEQTSDTPIEELIGKIKGTRNGMHNNVPDNEFRWVDDLVFVSAIRAFSANKSSSAHALKAYARQLESEIESVAKSYTETPDEPEVVPPHLDGHGLVRETKL